MIMIFTLIVVFLHFCTAAPRPPVFNVQLDINLEQALLNSHFPKFDDASGFLSFTNGYLEKASKELNEASWAYATNITDFNQEVQTDFEVRYNLMKCRSSIQK
jgi:hypothetical protein